MNGFPRVRVDWLVAIAALAVTTIPAPAAAAAPGMNLNWNDCLFSGAYSNLRFTCDDNSQSARLVASFRLAQALPDFVGVSVRIDCVVESEAPLPWWQAGPGGCREGEFAAIPVDSVAGCTNPYAGELQAGGFVQDPWTRGWFHLRADWARASIRALAADSLYAAFVMRLTSAKALDEGFGSCEGCAVSACFLLAWIEVYGLNTGLAARLESPERRDQVGYQLPEPQIGGIFCATPSLRSTWGAVKALYRSLP